MDNYRIFKPGQVKFVNYNIVLNPGFEKGMVQVNRKGHLIARYMFKRAQVARQGDFCKIHIYITLTIWYIEVQTLKLSLLMMSKTDIHYDVKKLIDTFVVPKLYLKAHEKNFFMPSEKGMAPQKKGMVL